MSNIIKKESGETTPVKERENEFEVICKFKEVKLSNGEYKPELIKQVGTHEDLDALFSASDTELLFFPEEDSGIEIWLVSEEADTKLGFYCEHQYGRPCTNNQLLVCRKDCYLMFHDSKWKNRSKLTTFSGAN